MFHIKATVAWDFQQFKKSLVNNCPIFRCMKKKLVYLAYLCYFCPKTNLNPNLGGWGCIWLLKLWTGITPQCLKIQKILKLMYSSKKSREYILLSTYERRTAFLVIYKQKVRKTAHFFTVFVYFLGRHWAYLTPLTPSTTTSCPGTPPQ